MEVVPTMGLVAVVSFAAADTASKPTTDAARACTSYAYTHGKFRLRVSSIKARKVRCKDARSLIRRFDAKARRGFHQVGSTISIGPWKSYVFRSYNPTHTNGLCTRPGGGRVSWVETWLNPPSAAGVAALKRFMPTGLITIQRRPSWVLIEDISKIVHGDHGDALLAGVTRSKRLGPPSSLHLRSFGRLHWTSWNASGGRAYGAMWISNCSPTCAQGQWRRIKATIRVFRANYAGIFIRMTVHAGRHGGTVAATPHQGLWFWH